MLAIPVSVDLLLRLMEAPTLLVTQRTLQHTHRASAGELIQSGLLVPAGLDTAVVAPDEEDTPSYAVNFDNHRRQLGYYSPTRGWIRVEQWEIERYRINIDRTASMLLCDGLRRPAKGALEIEPGFLWELGLLRLLKTALTQVWFIRRLSDRHVLDKLRAATDRQPPVGKRLVLTSTPNERLPGSLDLEGSTIIPIGDVLDPYAPSQIDLGRLRARFHNRTVETAIGPLYLSKDNSTLTILHTEIFFGGEGQQKAIRLLVDAYRAGHSVNAANTLKAAGFGSSIRTFPQAFRKQWPQLKPYLKSRDTLWRFDV